MLSLNADTPANPGEPLPRVILGSGRSGTTWVLDCLASANGLRPLFEPLHPVQSPMGARYAYRALLAGDEEGELAQHFRDLAAGRVGSLWIDYRGRKERLFPHPKQLASPRAWKRLAHAWATHLRVRRALRPALRREQTLVKCIRANLMAGWLARTLGFRTALIVRHPCATTESQYRLGGPAWDPAPVLTRYRDNHRLHELTGGRYVALLNTRLTTLQALALNWVIENQWPVERSQEDGYGVVYYEHLLSQPAAAWKQLCEALELAQLPEVAELQKPSQQASLASLQKPTWQRHQPHWQRNLSAEQLDEIQWVLDETECALYSTRDAEPLQGGQERAARA